MKYDHTHSKGLNTATLIGGVPTHSKMDGSPQPEEIAQSINRILRDVRESIEKTEDGSEERFGARQDLQQQMGAFSKLLGVPKTANNLFEVLEEFQRIMERIKIVAGADDDISITEGIVSRLEGLVLYITQLTLATSVEQMVVDTMMYVKTLVKGSLLERVKKILHKLFDAIKGLLGKINAPRKTKKRSFRFQAGKIKTNWERFTSGAVGEKVSALLNLVIMLGVMPAEAETTLGKEFYATYNLRMNARRSGSMFEHVVNCLDYVVDCVYPAVKTKNWWLLLDDKDMDDMDKQYREAIAVVDMWISGQNRKLKEDHKITDIAQVIVKLHKVQEVMMVVKVKADGPAKTELNFRLMKVDKILNDIMSKYHDTAVRIQPYSILVRGGSAHAKTTLSTILGHAICQHNEIPQGEEYRCTINGDDEFQSEITPQTRWVIFDDMCNTKPEMEKKNPLFVLIQFINNMHVSALSAIAERKGQNDVRVDLVMVTTNTVDLNVSYYSMNPASVMRRFNLVIDVTIPKNCRDERGDIRECFVGQSMPDMWTLRAWDVKLDRAGEFELADKWHLESVPVGGRSRFHASGGSPIYECDVVDMIDFVTNDSEKYYARQKKIVESTDLDKMPHCDLHPNFTMPCPKCTKLRMMGDEPKLVTGIPVEEPVVKPVPTIVNDMPELEDASIGSISEVDEKSLEEDIRKLKPNGGSVELVDVKEDDDESDVLVPPPSDWFTTQAPLVEEEDDDDEEFLSAKSTSSANNLMSRFDALEAEMLDPEDTVEMVIPEAKTEKYRRKMASKWKSMKHTVKSGVKKLVKPLKKRKLPENAEYPLNEDVFEMRTNFSNFAARKPSAQTGNPYIGTACGMEWRNAEYEPLDRIVENVQHKITPLKKLKESLKKIDNKYRMLVFAAGAAGVALIVYSRSKRLNEQGAVLSAFQMNAKTPKMLADHSNLYQKNWRMSMGPSLQSISMDRGSFETRVDNHLRVMLIQEIDPCDNPIGPQTYCNTFPLGGGDWIVAGHTFKKGHRYDVSSLVIPKNQVGIPHHRYKVDDSNYLVMKGKDIGKLILKTGDNWNARKYLLPKACDPMVGDPLVIYHRSLKAVTDPEHMGVMPSSTCIRTKVSEISWERVQGGGYQRVILYDMPRDQPTFDGMCGSLVVLDTKDPVILGIHTAGDGCLGACTAVSREEWESLEIPTLGERIYIGEEVPLAPEIQGTHMPASAEYHGRHPANWMKDDVVHSYQALGTVNVPPTRFSTEVIDSCIAEKMTEVLGVEQKHSGPDKKAATKLKHKHFTKITEEPNPMNPQTLEYAKVDYLKKINTFIDAAKAEGLDLKEFIHVVPKETALDGQRGVPGYDPIPIKTAMGLGCPGKKEAYLVANDVCSMLGIDTKKVVRQVLKEDGTYELHFHVRFDPKLYDLDKLLEEMIEKFGEQTRVNIVFKANLKDEALLLSKVQKGKIRVFAGAPTHFVTLCRMVGLASLVTPREFPSVFEDATGMNALGPDWQFVYNYVTKFGENRLGDGDYSSWDTSPTSLLNLTSMDIKKSILKRVGYTENELKIFDGIATEICLPIYSLDGGLVKVQKTVPSGHSFTVELNGIDNKLLLRYAYYQNHIDHHPKVDFHPDNEAIPLFHMVIAAIVLGDDNLFGVHKDEPYFSHKTMAMQMAKIGIKYTTANKTEEERDFIHISECSFLKRSFKHHEGLGTIVGPLEIDSIHKSLMCTQRTQADGNTEAKVMAQNMENALYECYLHGEPMYWKYYDAFEQMVDVRDRSGARIGSHYSPPSIQEMKDRFFRAKCRFWDNMSEYGVPESMGPSRVLKTQVGTVGRPPWWYVRDRKQKRKAKREKWPRVSAAMKSQIYLAQVDRMNRNYLKGHHHIQLKNLLDCAMNDYCYQANKHYSHFKGAGTFGHEYSLLQWLPQFFAAQNVIMSDIWCEDISRKIASYNGKKVHVMQSPFLWFNQHRVVAQIETRCSSNNCKYHYRLTGSQLIELC